MAGMPGEMPVPQAQFPVSNGMQKQDVGVMPDPLTSALNAFLTQMSGTNYNMNQAATSVGPERTPGGLMPGGMMVGVGQQPPMPEPNPMFHPQSPLEYDLGAMMRQAMVPPTGTLAPAVGPADMAMGGDPNAIPAPAKATPPKKVEKKAPAADKPQRAKGKGAEPKNEPKQKVPPPSKKRMIAEK